ncbi:HAD family hydrolase [Clostridium manihotivorum]|uniref:HAD family hydrolase n=1 Tax=Clostridium manihotivorum TaxID=2320868 RepID=A0A410DX51_9CLOT|nr:HAD family hydrolase [Clostridium manihotivorum]QAA33647.1 HAD family hydrolase [Clostridium manihotivorum]
MIKNIIFDVDGTLWDTTEVVARAWNKAIEMVGGTKAVITSDVLKKEFGKTMDVIANNLFFDANEDKKKELLKKCCECEHEFLEDNKENLLFPKVRETIEKLSKECNLYIVSNCQCGYIELFMRKTGIERYIKDHECFGNTGKSKGDNIKLVVERNHLEDVVYIGDTQGDYEATVVAKVPFVYARYGFGNVEGYDFAIDSMEEMLNLL